MFPDNLRIVLSKSGSNTGTAAGISVAREISVILVSISGEFSAISVKVSSVSISVSGVSHIRPRIGVVGIAAADVDVGGHLVDARLKRIFFSKLFSFFKTGPLL
jgi:hypothetical protein